MIISEFGKTVGVSVNALGYGHGGTDQDNVIDKTIARANRCSWILCRQCGPCKH